MASQADIAGVGLLDDERPGSEGRPKRAVRTSKPKTRTGCVTCKIRHVKCDETKPECDRCTSTGRKCDGYYIRPRKKQEPRAVVRKNPSSIPAMDKEELKALYFFYHKTAPALSSYFDADFWTRLVFQMSYCEASIRHAMTAVASLHEMRDRKLHMEPADLAILVRGPVEVPPPLSLSVRVDGEDGFALTQYNRAISELSARMDGSPACMQVTLIACILFVCVENLRGDRESTNKHFRAGMNIAISFLLGNDTPWSGLQSHGMFRDSMIPIFNRLELLSMVLGYESEWDYPVNIVAAVPSHFASMREARDSLVHLGNFSIRFIRSLRPKRHSQAVLADDYATRSTILAKLEQWRSTLDTMIQRQDLSAADLEGSQILRLHYMVTINWLYRCLSVHATCTDSYNDFYAEAIDLAESIFQSQTSEASNQKRFLSSTTFLFDTEIVSPLYYLAKQCRHPVIRRRAIALLKQTQRREGLWDSDLAAVIAERIMNIEETNMVVFDGSELPALPDRVWRSSHNPSLTFTPRSYKIDFYSRPEGISGNWKVWTEELTMRRNTADGLNWEQSWSSRPQLTPRAKDR